MNDSAARSKIEEPTFTCFPKLLPELRLEIWGHALSDPRAITLISRSKFPPGTVHHFKEGESVFTLVRSTAKQPVLLQVNFEARKFALAKYERTSRTLLSLPIYFNPDVDTFKIQALGSDTMDLFQKGWAHQTKEQEHEMNAVRQVVRHFMFREGLAYAIGFMRALSKSPKLTSITMLERPRRPSPGSDLESVRKFGVAWKQIIKSEAKVPDFFFKPKSEMDEDFKVREPYSTSMYEQILN